jgi:serine/threonine-protein kinase
VDPLRWKRISELFAAARQLDGERRLAFLHENCGQDQDLCQRVQSLLDIDNQHGPLDSRATASTIGVPQVVAGRFRIIRYIAEGGMGTVYEAEDLQLSDHVALKTIRPDIASNPQVVERFKQEIRLGKRVTHPNICRIHDLGTYRSQDGTEALFLTMQFLSGETLSSRITRSPIPKSEALPLIEDMANALSAAHEAEVIHRDFKSGNVMLVPGANRTCAVVTDFGLARGVRDNGSLTRSGLVGTVDYMAPEQITGGEITPATDIYAFGVVMYEVVTGQRPFIGDSKGSVIQKHLKDEPQPPRELAPQLDPNWNDAILRCLRKPPAERFQSAADVKAAFCQNGKSRGGLLRRSPKRALSLSVIALAAVVSIAALILSFLLIPPIGERLRGLLFSSSEKHIAVLPLDFVGDNSETQALGDGMMDSLSGRLSNLDVANKGLWVIPASEVRSRKVNDPASAWREFGATIIVKGSFERSKQAARLTLTLIDPKKMKEIGFVDVESQTGDLAALQDEAVTRLGRLMNISVREVRGGGEPPTRAAYEDYLAGIGYFQRHDKPGNIELAISALQSAVNTDPSFALGFARLAEVYIMKYRLNSNPKWLAQAEAYARQAAELDSRVPSTYAALGQIHELTGNHGLAIEEFQRAIDLDPRDSEALGGMAEAYKNAGRNPDAEAAYIKAAALRPNDWKGYNDLGIFYESIGRPHDAIIQFNRALQLTPDNSWPYTNLAMAYMDLDDPKMLGEAENALKKSIAVSPTFGAYSNLGFLYAEQHRFRESIAASQAALKLNDQNGEVWVNLAVAYEWLKDHEKAQSARRKAIQLLERAVKVNPQYVEAQATLAALYAKEGFRDKALDGIHTSLALSSNNQYVLSQVADAYELMGDRKKAIQYLQKAVAQGLTRGLLNEDPEIQGVVSDPGFRFPGT